MYVQCSILIFAQICTFITPTHTQDCLNSETKIGEKCYKLIIYQKSQNDAVLYCKNIESRLVPGDVMINDVLKEHKREQNAHWTYLDLKVHHTTFNWITGTPLRNQGCYKKDAYYNIKSRNNITKSHISSAVECINRCVELCGKCKKMFALFTYLKFEGECVCTKNFIHTPVSGSLCSMFSKEYYRTYLAIEKVEDILPNVWNKNQPDNLYSNEACLALKRNQYEQIDNAHSNKVENGMKNSAHTPLFLLSDETCDGFERPKSNGITYFLCEFQGRYAESDECDIHLNNVCLRLGHMQRSRVNRNLNSWYAAKEKCIEKGGRLASLESSAIQREVLSSSILKNLTDKNPAAKIWIGATREHFTSDSIDSNKVNLSSVKWTRNAKAYSSTRRLSCVISDIRNVWSLVACNKKHKFFCESDLKEGEIYSMYDELNQYEYDYSYISYPSKSLVPLWGIFILLYTCSLTMVLLCNRKIFIKRNKDMHNPNDTGVSSGQRMCTISDPHAEKPRHSLAEENVKVDAEQLAKTLAPSDQNEMHYNHAYTNADYNNYQEYNSDDS